VAFIDDRKLDSVHAAILEEQQLSCQAQPLLYDDQRYAF
jgi:hypothetical protein